eukprot:400504_1
MKEKFVTNVADVTVYGFGEDHSHPHLSPKSISVREELLWNDSCRLQEKQFQELLITAIRKQQIALIDHRDTLLCKYFHKEYGIIKNEPIAIRHLLSIVVYVDISHFCTIFRQTYRKINNERTEQVTERHTQFYYYSKALFETIEFFGQCMSPTLKVYHGLNRKMYFERFSAYFNQPVSTTLNLDTAQRFSEGVGIILTLRAGTESFDDSTKIPR